MLLWYCIYCMHAAGGWSGRSSWLLCCCFSLPCFFYLYGFNASEGHSGNEARSVFIVLLAWTYFILAINVCTTLHSSNLPSKLIHLKSGHFCILLDFHLFKVIFINTCNQWDLWFLHFWLYNSWEAGTVGQL